MLFRKLAVILLCCWLSAIDAQNDSTRRIGIDFSPLNFLDIKPNVQFGTLIRLKDNLWLGQQASIINPYIPFWGIGNYANDFVYKNTNGFKLKTDLKFIMPKVSSKKHLFYVGPEVYYQMEHNNREITYSRYNNAYFQEIKTKIVHNMLGANFRFGGMVSSFAVKKVYFEYFFSAGIRYLNTTTITALPEDAVIGRQPFFIDLNYNYGISPVKGNNYLLPYFGLGIRLGGWIK